jgi:glycosyltransferase involved in cell wall biosynthesis
MKSIKILTICYNTADFVLNLFENIKSVSSMPFVLVVVDNGSHVSELEKLKSVSKSDNFKLMQRQQADIYAPSRHHGEAIHCGIDSLADDDIVSIIDCDSVIIENSWDSHIVDLLSEYDHVTCKRPGAKFGCGAWFSAFRVGTVRNMQINFLPKLKENGSDLKSSDRYDVGSDLIRIENWKQLIRHPEMRFSNRGHLWLLDNKPFIDHMGKCRNSQMDFKKWKKWTKQHWGK